MSSFRVVMGICLGLGLATSAPVWATPYDELKQANGATPIRAVAKLRADAKVLAGKVVELQGEITGVMTREKSRIVLLKVRDDMTVLSIAPELTETSLLRAGVLVSVLARVETGDPAGVLTLLAVQEGTAPAPLPPAGDSAEIGTSMVTMIGNLPPSPETTTVATKPVEAAVPVANRQPVKLVSQKPSPGELEELIDAQVPAYSAIVRRHNSKLKPEVVAEISEALLRAGYKYNMDPRFLAAIIAVESNFDPRCVSRSGAMGLGQLMPFNLKPAGVQNPWDPTQNIMGCAKLLRGLLDDYQKRPNATLLAVAAYNAGSGAVRRAGYKVPPGAQVQRYVWKVYYRYKAFAPDMF